MRILIISQYFWPETFIINDLAMTLHSDGHEITVATGKPNYPSGQIAPGYRAGGTMTDTFSGAIRVVRVPMRPRGSGSARNLAANYLSFAASASWHLPRLLRGETYDVVLVFAVSPITAALPAIVMKVVKHAHLAIWIQDLWPDSLEATGFVKNRAILKGVALMVRGIYAAADTLLVQSKGFISRVERFAAPGKTIYFPNFAPARTAAPKPLPRDTEALLDGSFIVVFAGNLGKAQDLDTVLDAAKRLRVAEPEIRFVIAGDGSEAKRIARLVREDGLSNVHLTGWIDGSSMPELFGNADALLVTLGKTPSLEATIPSKLPAYMQAGKPILGALDGEGARVIEEAEAGLVVASGDGESLAAAILTLMRMSPSTRADMGAKARQTFLDQFEAGQAARNLVTILFERLRRTRTS